MLAMGTSAALVLGAGPQATADAEIAQETTTTTTEAATQNETANVTFTNQTSNGTAVVVQRVVLPEGGFVVIHAVENETEGTQTEVETETEEEIAQNETEFEGANETQMEDVGETTTAEAATQQYVTGAVLGNSTYLEPGVHENVTVLLDQPIEESQVLIAMPHQDTNDNQQYDFPEADDPYTVDGQPVTDWAFVTLEDGANETTTATGNETTTEEM